MSYVRSLGGAAASLAVQLVGFFLFSLLFTVRIPTFVPDTFHIDYFAWPFRDPVISVLEPGPRAADDGEEGPGSAERCRPGPDIDRLARPAFPLLQGRPLLWSGRAGRDPLVCARIGADGRIDSAYVLRGSGDAATDEAAMTALGSLSFRPAEADGAPRAAWHKLLVHVGNPFIEVPTG